MVVILSLFIAALGQPGWIPWLAPVAATLGYALFWKEAVGISNKWRRFWVATLWFALVQAIQLSWMTATEFQGLYILAVYAAICFCLGLQFGLITLCIEQVPFVAVAAFWTLLEWARLHFFCGFSWNPVGLSLTAFIPSMQMASLFGILGLSFWVILTNLAALKKNWTIWAAMTIFPYFFGLAHIAYHDKSLKESPELSVALVQTGLLPSEKMPILGRTKEYIQPYEQWRRILSLLKEQEQKFDLVVLPEYAVPFSADATVYSPDRTRSIFAQYFKTDFMKTLQMPQRVSNTFWVQTISRALEAEVIAGLEAEDGGKHYAAAFHFSPFSDRVDRYDKQVLVPLAEYIPFTWLKQFTEKYGIIEFFTHGEEAKVFPGKVPLSVSICYEETFSHLIREGRIKGAELFVNVTNDNWYPSSHLPKQHFDHGRIRSIENGVPLIRSCNTGITAAIDSLGRCVAQISEERTAAILTAKIPTYHYATLYTFWGDWGIVIFSCLFIGVCWFNSRNYLTCSK